MKRKPKVEKSTEPILVQVETLEIKLHRVAEYMADCFLKHFNTTSIISWHCEASGYLFNYYKQHPAQENDSAGPFLSTFGYNLFVFLLDAKTVTERRQVLIEQLPELFQFATPDILRECLATLGQAYCFSFGKFRSDEQIVKDFMQGLSCFFQLGELFYDHEFYAKQIAKEAKSLHDACTTSPIAWDHDLKSFVDSHSN